MRSVNEQLRDAYVVQGVTLARVQRTLAEMVDAELVAMRDEIAKMVEEFEIGLADVSPDQKQFRARALIIRIRRLTNKRMTDISVKLLKELETVGVAESTFTSTLLNRVLGGKVSI